MNTCFTDEDVKTRLILAGVAELEERGVRDFSLRRAAEAAGVSCAAPYRYFKDKEQYLASILAHLAAKWRLFFREVEHAWISEPARCAVELCLACIRFWLADGRLREALLVSGDACTLRLSEFDKPLSDYLVALFAERGAPEPEKCVVPIRALIYGYVSLMGSGELAPTEEAFADVRLRLSRLIESRGD